MTPADFRRIVDAAHVGMAAHGHNALTGGPVDRLPPHLWDALRIELQRRYRNATGEEFAVLIAEDNPAHPLQARTMHDILREQLDRPRLQPAKQPPRVEGYDVPSTTFDGIGGIAPASHSE